MSLRMPAILVVAFMIALGTAFLVKGRLRDASQQENLETAPVLVAKTAISAGHFIRAEADLQWMAWPADNINTAYIVKGAADPVTFEGAVARSDILEGEPIIASRLVKPDDGGFMPAVLRPGMRAVSISVNATTGNAGFIFPGDHVDMILTHTVNASEEGGDGPGYVSETFAHDVRVLAVDQRFNTKDNTVSLARTVTLEVSPKQAEMTNVAMELGRISLSLRSLAGKSIEDAGKNVSDLSNDTSNGYTGVKDVSRMLGSHQEGNHLEARRVSVSRGSMSEQISF